MSDIIKLKKSVETTYREEYLIEIGKKELDKINKSFSQYFNQRREYFNNRFSITKTDLHSYYNYELGKLYSWVYVVNKDNKIEESLRVDKILAEYLEKYNFEEITEELLNEMNKILSQYYIVVDSYDKVKPLTLQELKDVLEGKEESRKEEWVYPKNTKDAYAYAQELQCIIEEIFYFHLQDYKPSKKIKSYLVDEEFIGFSILK